MKRLFLACLTLSVLSAGFISSAAAEQPPVSGEVVILRFDTMNVEQALMDRFYSTLHGAIEADSGLSLASGGDVSVEDLLLMAGCEEASADCLAMVGDFVAGDLILFGSVQRSDDVHMFSLHLFSFSQESFVREVRDQTLRGDESWLAEGVPAVIEHFLHGKTAGLEIVIENAPDTEVRINGAPAGKGSMTVDSLAPGEMVVVVRTPDGQEEMQRTILRHNETKAVKFEFEGGAVADITRPDRAERGGASPLPGLLVTGVGVAGLVVGILGNSQLAAAESEANQLVGGRNALDQSELAYAQDLQQRMNSAHTMRVVGLSAGSLGIAAGGALLFRALTGGSGSADSELASQRLELQLAPSADGFSAGLRLEF